MILGEIKRIFRDTGAIKVSRSLKELSLKVTTLSERYEKEKGEPLSAAKAAEILGVSAEDINEALNATRPVMSLTYDEDGENKEYEPSGNDEEDIYNKVYVSEILSQLSAVDRRIIILRHFVGLTQSEVADKLNMTQVQISRKERKIIEKINENYKS